MSGAAARPFRPLADGIALSVRVTPKGGANRIEGLGADAAGQAYLKVRVTAVPEKGKANAAVLRLLAKSLRLPRTALEVTIGESDRNKVVVIKGDPAALAALLEERLAATALG